MKPDIKVGQVVTFENDHGPQTGVVLSLMPDVSNGQPFAVVQVQDDPLLTGIVVSVPLDDIEVSA